jgi:hypothetical protein
MPFAAPIVIMAFNRPEYLAEVLNSLCAQRGADLAGRPIFLFQDGGRNPISGTEYATPAEIAANIEVFRRIIPAGVPMVAPVNLGIALNFERAERFVFEELDSPAAIFLEDDYVLGPYYLTILEQLLDVALRDPRIGYVAAYGDHVAPVAEVRAHPDRLVHMSHNWAIGLTRRQWLRQKPLVDAYLALVRGQDYRLRRGDPIIDLFHQWGLGASSTSQDYAKANACYLTGAARITTYACFGRYIGRQGVHFDPPQFEAGGYAATPVIEEDLFRFTEPSAEDLRRLLDAGRQSQMGDVLPRTVPKPGVPRPGEAATADARVRWLIEAYCLDEAETLALEWQAHAAGHRDEANRPAFLTSLLRIALARGRWARARELADRLAAEAAPDDPGIRAMFAHALHRAGRLPAALAEWHAVLALQPRHPEALAAVASLGSA